MAFRSGVSVPKSQMVGGKEFAARLQNVRQKCPTLLAMAMVEEAMKIKEVSQSRTPVDRGWLRDDQAVLKPEIHGNEVTVRIGVGGRAEKYCVYVHEMTWLYHKIGQAKFLESAVNDAAPGYGKRIAERIDFYKMFTG